MTSAMPSRGEIWQVDLDPTRGHEQAGKRPGLVISVDTFSHGPAGLVVLVPLTTRERGIPLHVRVEPRTTGLREVSFAKCEDVRSVSRERLLQRVGQVPDETLAAIEDRLRMLLGL
jgi:mRNA interferase MazF